MSKVSRREFNAGLLAGLSVPLLWSRGSSENASTIKLGRANSSPYPLIFPEPREMRETGRSFRLDDKVVIALPLRPSPHDIRLARVLQRDLSDRYGLGVRTLRMDTIPAHRRLILLGAISNPLISRSCERRRVSISQNHPGREGYVLQVDEQEVLVAGSDDDGAFYGVQSLRQLIESREGEQWFRGVDIRDWPYKPFRGAYVFLPGRAHIPFFKRFVCDFMALYKFNKLVIEFNGQMRFDSHPEMTAGWIEFLGDLYYTRRDRPLGPRGTEQDSANGNSTYGLPTEKSEVEEIVRWAAESHVEVIPQIASLTHSYYLLTRHREIAAVQAAEWPDTYCPSNPETYGLLFDVLDEVIEVTKPRMIHIGHDEWRIPLNLCRCCVGKDPTEQFIRDVTKIYQHLREKNVRTAMFGDHFIESLRGSGTRSRVTKNGYRYEMPGALSPDQIRRSIPKDVLVFNWFWDGASGQADQKLLADLGFDQVYGNLTSDFQNYGFRSSERGVLGGAPSLWSSMTEFNFCKEAMYEFLACADLLWSAHGRGDRGARGAEPQLLAPKSYARLRGAKMPSETGDPVRMISVDASLKPIPIQEDVSSLVFVHHAAAASFDLEAYTAPYNPKDSAALLGWYEVLYEDEFIETVPVRYAVNILERSWRAGKRSGDEQAGDFSWCPEATPIPVGQEMFFAYEWVNPRFGKKIREVRLRQTSNLTDLVYHRPYPPNPITLHSVRVVRKRSFPGSDRARNSDLLRE